MACSYRLASAEIENADDGGGGGGGGGDSCGCRCGLYVEVKKVVVSQLSSNSIMVVSFIHPSSGMMFYSSIHLFLDPPVDAFIQSVATCLG